MVSILDPAWRVLLCLIFWYMNMRCNVHWGTEISRSFDIPLRIKQGGCYFDGHADVLHKGHTSCHMFAMFGRLFAFILFAEDLCPLAPTRSALEKLIK